MKVELEAVCKTCTGTGLYVGIAEQGGDAVVCHTCKGSGCNKIEIEYEPFHNRQDPSSEITRIYQTGVGVISHPDFTSGGVSVQEWQADSSSARRAGAEMRSHTCPAWWYQTADYSKKPNWDECAWGGSFSQCRYFPEKAGCWERFDRENQKECEGYQSGTVHDTKTGT